MARTKRQQQTHSRPDPDVDHPIAGDLIWGAAAIGDEIGIGERKAFYLLDRRLIPARKIGGLWVASRRQLRAAFLGAEAADAA